MIKVVFDSTVLVSAFLKRIGVAALVVEQGKTGVFQLCVSEEILSETPNHNSLALHSYCSFVNLTTTASLLFLEKSNRPGFCIGLSDEDSLPSMVITLKSSFNPNVFTSPFLISLNSSGTRSVA